LKKDLPQHSPTEEEKEETVEWNKIVTTQLEKKRIEELTERALAGGGDSDDDDDADGDQAGGGGGAGGGEYVLQNGEMKYLKKKKVNPNSFIFSFKIRKKHYQLKLERIEKLIKESEQEQVAIDINRVKYTTLLHEKQRRVIEIQSEIDRVVNFNGLEIVSSVLQGVEMTYLTMTLKSLLQTTWMTLLQEISLTKHEVILGEKKKKEIIIRLQSLQLEKQERKAKMINFLNEYEKQQRIMTNLVNGSSRFSLLKIHFEKLKQFQKLQKEMKKNIREAFVTCSRRFLKSAFEKWLTGKFSQDDDGATSGGTSGVGTRLLHKTRLLREEMQSSLRQELAQTFQIKKQLTLSTSYSLQQQSKFISSDLFPVMEDGGMNSLHLVIDEGMKFLYEGDGYVATSQYHQAESCYDAQIILLRSRLPLKIKYLAICHGRLGKLYLRQERYDRAIVEFDRQMSLGNEIGDKVEIADAYYGLGTGYFSLLEYQESIRYLEIASSRYETLGNIPKYCGCLYLLKDCYQRLNKVDLMELYLKKVKEVEGELHEKMRRMHQKLEKMTGQLRLNSAVFELEVKIERSSPRILFLKHELEVCHEKLLEEQEVLADQQQICHGVEELLDAIQRELEISKTTEELEMMSYLVHDQPQMVNVEEVKTRLHKRRVEILEKYRAEKEIELGIVTRIKNLEHAIEVHDEEVSIELGDLMRKVKNNRPFRVIAFNPANAASDEVTGTATGGVENFISAESSNLHVIDYHNGELLHVYSGDSRSRLGEKLGHIGVITCLAYDQNRIYSGGADELIMVWDHMSHQRVMVLTGHEGSIVSLAVHGFMLMSGGADATIRLWDKGTGRELRIIHGHSESVLSIDLGANWMVTASSDEEVRVWEIKEKSRHTIKVDTKFRLQGHGTAVTVAKYGKLEVVSGDKKGDIIVWWVETGAIVQHIKGVHTGRVNCLQFDATRKFLFLLLPSSSLLCSALLPCSLSPAPSPLLPLPCSLSPAPSALLS
jgi:WD40 repeat protein